MAHAHVYAFLTVATHFPSTLSILHSKWSLGDISICAAIMVGMVVLRESLDVRARLAAVTIPLSFPIALLIGVGYINMPIAYSTMYRPIFI